MAETPGWQVECIVGHQPAAKAEVGVLYGRARQLACGAELHTGAAGVAGDGIRPGTTTADGGGRQGGWPGDAIWGWIDRV